METGHYSPQYSSVVVARVRVPRALHGHRPLSRPTLSEVLMLHDGEPGIIRHGRLSIRDPYVGMPFTCLPGADV